MQFYQTRMTGIRASQKEKDLSRLLYRTFGSGLCCNENIFDLQIEYNEIVLPTDNNKQNS